VTATVKQSLQDSCVQILSPKRRIDILRDAMDCKQKRRPYTITFCGVNGVGKSTNLAKVIIDVDSIPAKDTNSTNCLLLWYNKLHYVTKQLVLVRSPLLFKRNLHYLLLICFKWFDLLLYIIFLIESKKYFALFVSMRT
jgi:pantothenate kinase-related protein Tda10